MDPHPSISFVLLSLLLIAASAFFVAAEFSLITLRYAVPDARKGGPPRDPERLLWAAQLGSSLATLLLGLVAARLAARAWPGHPWTATAPALLAVALLHAVLGAQVPKLVGLQRVAWVERGSVHYPLRALSWLLQPLLLLLQGLHRLAARLLGLQPEPLDLLAHVPEGIRLLVRQGHDAVADEGGREMLAGVFRFSAKVAREVMTPRTDMVAVPVDVSLPELLAVIGREEHSRIPIYEETPDSVVGVLLVKDLLPLLARRDAAEGFDARRLMREPYFVPDTKPVDELLAEFRQHKLHLAIVLDEFGGTYGLVTMEDLLEEIVGEIDDEYDVSEPEYTATPEGDVLIDGGMPLSEVNERFALALPQDDYDTLGGYIFGALGRVPAVGDEVEAPGGEAGQRLRVEETEERRIARARLVRAPVAAGAPA